jgi:hypothetical protein
MMRTGALGKRAALRELRLFTLIAGVVTVSLLGAASTSASRDYTYPPKHFHIHNLTTTPMKLIGVEWDGNPDRSETAPPPPKVGDVLTPGAPASHVAIEHKKGPAVPAEQRPPHLSDDGAVRSGDDH